MHTASRSVAVIGILFLAVAGAGASFALVTSETDKKVDICHASISTQIPYSTDQVDTSSVDLNGHVNHTGPIFTPGMEGGWGDIIPPVPDILPNGLNWPEGEATLLNGCNFVSPAPSPTPTQTPVPVDGNEGLPDESVPLGIADPGALATEDRPVAIDTASPQRESVPTSVPAGGGAASGKR